MGVVGYFIVLIVDVAYDDIIRHWKLVVREDTIILCFLGSRLKSNSIDETGNTPNPYSTSYKTEGI